MNRSVVIAGLLALFLASCTTAPKPPGPPPLPTVRVKEIRDLLAAGSYLQGIEGIDTLRREKADVLPADLDSIQAQAVASLSTAFDKAVEEFKRVDSELW